MAGMQGERHCKMSRLSLKTGIPEALTKAELLFLAHPLEAGIRGHGRQC